MAEGQDSHGAGPAQVVEEVPVLHLDRDPVPQRTDAAGVDFVPVEVTPWPLRSAMCFIASISRTVLSPDAGSAPPTAVHADD